jgi:ATP synthase protein I
MKNAAQYKSLGAYGTIGLEIVLSILVGLWIGTKLDAWLGTTPWMAVAWFGLGCAAAGKAVYRSWKQMQAAAKREEAEEGNPAQQFPDEKAMKWKREEEALAREAQDDVQHATDRAEKRDG